MIQFNEKLKNYKSQNFKIVSIDAVGTRVRNDAYTIDKYDDEHFFIGVYIANPFHYEFNDKKKLTYHVLNRLNDRYTDSYRNIHLSPCTLNDKEKKDAVAFKFVIDFKGNVTDFAINKEKIQIDYKLNTYDVYEIFTKDEDDMGSAEYEVYTTLSTMHVLNDIIFSNLHPDKNVDLRDNEIEYGLDFIKQFLDLCNTYTAEFLQKNNIPFLTYNKIIKDSTMDSFKFLDAYYQKKFDGNEDFDKIVGNFTSPLRSGAALINLAIIDDFFIDKKSISQYNLDYWEKNLDGIKIGKPLNFKKPAMERIGGTWK